MQISSMRNKKGQVSATNYGIFNIFTIGIVIFMAVIFFGGLIYVSGLMNDAFHSAGLSNEVNSGKPGYVNMTLAAENTFGKMNSSIQALRLVAAALVFSEILFFVVFVSFKRTHPFMFVAFMFIVFLAVLLAVPISNGYEAILRSGIYAGLLNSFTITNWVLLNLPLVNLMIGIFGGIFMFISIVRTRDEGGL